MWARTWEMIIFSLSLSFFFFVFLSFRAALVAYGGFQARGRIGAVAAGLCHSHGNMGSKPRLRPTPRSRQCWILNPLSETRDQTCNLMVPSRICFCCATMETPNIRFFLSLSLFFFFFSASPAAYGGFQARGRIGATATGLHHSHSNTRSARD